MKVSQVIRTIKTQPQLWTLQYKNDILVGFTYEGYSFVKFTNNVESYKGQIKLVNKKLGVEMVWEGDDAVGSQLWSSVIMEYISSSIINK